MTKPVVTGKRYQGAFEAIEEIAREGNREAILGLYFIIGDDKDAAIASQKTVIELFDLIAKLMSKMSKQQIYAALALLNEGKDK